MPPKRKESDPLRRPEEPLGPAMTRVRTRTPQVVTALGMPQRWAVKVLPEKHEVRSTSVARIMTPLGSQVPPCSDLNAYPPDQIDEEGQSRSLPRMTPGRRSAG
jgi:hypothetical protein